MIPHKLFRYLLFILFYLNFSLGQAQDLTWQKTLGGEQAEYLYNMVSTPDNGFILVGSSHSGTTGNKTKENKGGLDYFIWKLDAHGNQEWQNTFGGSGSDFLQTVAMTREGGYILGGSSDSPISGDKTEASQGRLDYWILKLNAQGEIEWQKTYGGNQTDELLSIEQTRDGGYIVAGSSESDTGGDKTTSTRGSRDFWVLKLDAKGGIQWQKTWGGATLDLLKSIKQTPKGDYILVGYSNSVPTKEKGETTTAASSNLKTAPSLGNGDFWVVKLSAEGNEIWQKTYGGEGNDHPYALLYTRDTHILIGGTSDSPPSETKKAAKENGEDFWLLKIDENGTPIWDATYDFGTYDRLVSLHENKDGSLVLGGYAETENPFGEDKKGINDYIFLKTDSKGTKKWEQIFGGDKADILLKAVETRDGNYVLAGTSHSGISRNKRVANNGQNDFWVVKVKDPVNDRSQTIPTFDIYPNPTERFVTVVWNRKETTTDKEGKAQLYDLAGGFLQEISLTSSSTVVDLNAYPKGVYLLTIKTENETETKKIVKK